MKIEVKCPCGKIIFFTPGQIRKGHGKYCSRPCFFKYRDNSKFLSLLTKKGKDNQNWKGDRAGYKAFHLRVNQMRGKADICEDCGSDSFVEWANLNKHYEDIYDYKKLCRKCHHKFDNKSAKAFETKKSYTHEIALKGWVTRRLRGGDASA